MTIWFTGDHHWGHANIIKYCNRPFSSVEEMDEVMIQNWNKRVKPKDTVYHLGDFALCKTSEEIEQLANSLNGEIHLILGNHDRHQAKTAKSCFRWRGHMKLFKLDKLKITMCHWAMEVWWCSHHGAWMLHGHSHGGIPMKGMRMDVGVDCWDFRPIAFEEVRHILAPADIEIGSP